MRSLLVVFLLVAPAAADPVKTTDVKAMHADDCALARKNNKQCVLDMKDEQIGGNGVSPDGTGVRVIEDTKHPSLIHIRRDFIVEILKTAEDL
jgi:hypothetical protein